MNPEILLGLGGVVTSALAYLAGIRRASGRISTTDADRLWAEAGRLRSDLMSRIESLESELAAKTRRISSLEDELRRAEHRIAELEDEARDRVTGR